MIRKIRILSQTLFFSLFVALFFLANSYPIAYSLDSDILLKLNPFSAIIVSIATREILWPMLWGALIIIAVTVLFGRVFCGFFCPLGAIIDFFDTYIFRAFRKKNRGLPLSMHQIKYVLMIVTLLLAFIGITTVLFLDPLALTTRLLTIIIYPSLQALTSQISRAYQSILSLLSIDLFNYPKILQPVMYGTVGALILVILILGGGLINRRFFCQYICPTGAFLALISRFAIVRRVASPATGNNCNGCSRVCPTHAIPPTDCSKTIVAECILCGACEGKNKECSRIACAPLLPDNRIETDISRRQSVLALAGAIIVTPLFKFNALSRSDGTGRFIRPPGAIPEEWFLKQCIACGACIKACPTNALQPAFGLPQVHRAFTPQVVPRIGGCEEKCYLCGHVCPTRAIRPLTLDEKQFVKIGTAVIDSHRCIAWEQQRECLVCDEVCPYNAIEVRMLPTVKGMFKVPVIHEDLCVGCGLCEQQCPVFDKAAIEVYRFGENRKLSGPYLNDFQKQSIEEQRQKINVITASNLSTVPNESNEIQTSVPIQKSSMLPPGFSVE